MKIVKNGRLFGKLNIVDVLILLVVIAAVAFLAVRMVGGSSGETIAADEPSAQANLRYTVLCEDMPLMQAENAVTAVTAEDYELKLDDDSILKVSRTDLQQQQVPGCADHLGGNSAAGRQRRRPSA